jgi:hypothetical protein
MINILKKKDGNEMIGACVGTIIMMMCVAFTLSIFGVVSQKQGVDTAAYEIVRMVQTDGTYDSAEVSKVSAYLTKCNIKSATVACDKSEEIPINTEFTITVKKSMNFGIGGIGSVPVTLKGVSTGEGDVYLKP